MFLDYAFLIFKLKFQTFNLCLELISLSNFDV